MEDRSKGSDVREEGNGIMMCVPRCDAAGFGSLWLELAELEWNFAHVIVSFPELDFAP
jgi:hypothetical protein